jgi:hypothetical protein
MEKVSILMRIDVVKPLPRFQIQQHIYQLMSKKEEEQMTEQSTTGNSKGKNICKTVLNTSGSHPHVHY